MSQKFNYSKLRGKIIENYKSIKDFAADLGFNYKTLSSKLNGIYPFKPEEMFAIKEKLSLNSIDEYFFCV